MTLNEIIVALSVLISSYLLIKVILISFMLDENIRLHLKVRSEDSNEIFVSGGVSIALMIISILLMDKSESILTFLQLYVQGIVLSAGFMLMNFILYYSKHLRIKSRLWDNYKKPAFLSLIVLLLSIFNEMFQKL